MGFYSALCHGCGHPLLADLATTDTNNWMTSGVAINPDGEIVIGEYDGFGHLATSMSADHTIGEFTYATFDGEPGDGFTNTVWHEACWEHAGSPTEYRGPSKHAPDQGWFFDNGAHDMPDPRPTTPAVQVRLRELPHRVELLIDGRTAATFIKDFHTGWNAGTAVYTPLLADLALAAANNLLANVNELLANSNRR